MTPSNGLLYLAVTQMEAKWPEMIGYRQLPAFQPKYSTIRYLPKTKIMIPHLESLHVLYTVALQPQGELPASLDLALLASALKRRPKKGTKEFRD